MSISYNISKAYGWPIELEPSDFYTDGVTIVRRDAFAKAAPVRMRRRVGPPPNSKFARNRTVPNKTCTEVINTVSNNTEAPLLGTVRDEPLADGRRVLVLSGMTFAVWVDADRIGFLMKYLPGIILAIGKTKEAPVALVRDGEIIGAVAAMKQ